MKQILFYISLYLFYFQLGYAQSSFNIAYGERTIQEGFLGLAQTKQGDLIGVGKCWLPSLEADYVFVTSFNEYGYTKWSKKYTLVPDGGHWARSVQPQEDGSLIIAGTITTDFINNKDDFYLMKLDKEGNKLWHKKYGGVDNEGLRSMIQTQDGGFALIGWTDAYNTNSNRGDAYVVKTDSLGNVEWDNHYGDESSNDGFSIQQTADNGFILAIRNRHNGTNDEDASLFKIDAMGNEEWTQYYMDRGDNSVGEVLIDTNGNYFLLGREDTRGYMAKIASNGDLIWEKNYRIDFNFNRHTIASATFSQEGSIVAAGTATPVEGNSKGWILKIDADGNEIWSKTYEQKNSERNNYFYNVIEDTDGNIITCGVAVNPPPEGSNMSDNDAWILKVDADGNDTSALGVGFDEGVTVCVGNPEFIAAYPYGGSEDYVTHQWTGEKVDWLIGTDVREPIINPIDTGTYTFQYSVTDSEGNIATEDFQITVLESPTTAFFNSQITIEVGSGPLLLRSHTSDGLPPYTHQWVGTGSPFLNFNDQEFVGFSGAPVGSYELTYIVTDANGCTAFDVLPIVVEDTTTVDIEVVDLSVKEEVLKVYPNPVRDVLQIEVAESISLKESKLLFYNALGQLVKRVELKERKMALEVGDWRKGVYFYRLSNVAEAVKCRRIFVH